MQACFALMLTNTNVNFKVHPKVMLVPANYYFLYQEYQVCLQARKKVAQCTFKNKLEKKYRVPTPFLKSNSRTFQAFSRCISSFSSTLQLWQITYCMYCMPFIWLLYHIESDVIKGSYTFSQSQAFLSMQLKLSFCSTFHCHLHWPDHK